LSTRERREPTLEIVRKEVLTSNPLKDPQQCEVNTLVENKNENGKRNIETQITGRKARKLGKKKEKLEKLQEVPEKTLQKASLQNLSLIGLAEPRRKEIIHDESI
jgi:hypothetical protein